MTTSLALQPMLAVKQASNGFTTHRKLSFTLWLRLTNQTAVSVPHVVSQTTMGFPFLFILVHTNCQPPAGLYNESLVCFSAYDGLTIPHLFLFFTAILMVSGFYVAFYM